MFQSFDSTASPEQGPPRLAALARKRFAAMGLQGFIVPRADVHQGEYVAARDERLSWLTGFHRVGRVLRGAAGSGGGLHRRALPDTGEGAGGPWGVHAGALARCEAGRVDPRESGSSGRVGFDPWLHTADEIEKLERSLEGLWRKPFRLLIKIRLTRSGPIRPCTACRHGRSSTPKRWPGESSAAKRARLAEGLKAAGREGRGASPCRIRFAGCLNIRGDDVPKNPVLHGFAFLQDDGRVVLFVNPAKSLTTEVRAHLGPEVEVRPL